MATPGLIPNANFGGTNVGFGAVPGGSNAPAIGGGQNPFLPTIPGQNSVPAPTTTSPTNLGGIDLSQLLGNWTANPNNPLVASGSHTGGNGNSLLNAWSFGMFGGSSGPVNPGQLSPSGNWVPNQKDFIKAFQKAGYSAGDAAMLYNFVSSGAGFNPMVAQALWNSMQPKIQEQSANILENFSSQGVRQGSPAAYGLSNYLGGVELNQEQILANLYEQSVQNYMNVLLSGKRNMQPVGSTFQNIMQWMQTAASAAGAATGAGG